MKYRIKIGARARRDITATLAWIAEDSERAARQWYRGVTDAIRSLEQFPERCPVAPEAGLLYREIRQLLYGNKRIKYRILFVIDENTVHVLTIRHGSRDRAEPPELY